MVNIGEEPRPEQGQVVIPWNVMVEEPYKPSARQREFHTAPERYKLFGGAIGGGKTCALACEALLLAWSTPGSVGVVARRDYDDLRRTTYEEVLKWLPPELIKQHHRSEHWIELIHPEGPDKRGSMIHFLQVSDRAAIRSLNLSWFAIDQAEEVSYDSFMWLQSRLRQVGTPHYYGLLSCNPSPGWLKHTFLIDRPPNHRFIRSLPEDNPYLPPDYVSNLLQTMPEHHARMLLRGEWDVVADAVYLQFEWERHVRRLEDDRRMQTSALGVDYGEVHPSSICAVTRDTAGVTWVRESWAAPTVTQDDFETLWDQVRRMQRTYDVPMYRVRVDPMLKGWDKYHGVKRADGSPGARNHRIGLVTALLNGKVPPVGRPQVPSMYFERAGPGVRELIEQLTGYRYERMETLTTEALRVVRKDDDRVAAMEYAIEQLEQDTFPEGFPTFQHPYAVRRGPTRPITIGRLR